MMYNSHATGIYIIAFVAITYLVVRHLASIELWTSGQVLIQGLHRPGNHMLGVIAYPAVDILALGGALAIATGFAGHFESVTAWKTAWVDQLPVWVGLPFLCMFMARTYSRVWSRARMSEFLLLGVAILAGTLVATGLTAVTLIIQPRDLALQFILHGSLSVTLIVGLRALPGAILDAMASSRTRGTASQSVRRLLLIGASSTQATLFLINQGFRLANDEAVAHVVGYIDNNRQLHGLYVGGQLVHGGIDQLESEIKAHNIDMLVIIDPLDDSDMQTVTTVADRNRIDVYAWTAGIRTIRKNRQVE
jgi:FlaA1/EpsC-like NDP-sugar epimerase